MRLVPSVVWVVGSCLARMLRCEGSLAGSTLRAQPRRTVLRQSDTIENFGMITQTAAKT
jgi:hypothetical protein